MTRDFFAYNTQVLPAQFTYKFRDILLFFL